MHEWLLTSAVFRTPRPPRRFKETYFVVGGRTQDFDTYEWNQRRIPTLRGDKVASRGEQQIADFLHTRGIEYVYSEDLILRDGNAQFRVRPDFYLSAHTLIIEFFGMIDNPEYTKMMEWKLGAYRRCNQKLIAVYPQHLPLLSSFLAQELKRHGI